MTTKPRVSCTEYLIRTYGPRDLISSVSYPWSFYQFIPGSRHFIYGIWTCMLFSLPSLVKNRAFCAAQAIHLSFKSSLAWCLHWGKFRSPLRSLWRPTCRNVNIRAADLSFYLELFKGHSINFREKHFNAFNDNLKWTVCFSGFTLPRRCSFVCSR